MFHRDLLFCFSHTHTHTHTQRAGPFKMASLGDLCARTAKRVTRLPGSQEIQLAEITEAYYKAGASIDLFTESRGASEAC